jgi:TatD DNase family protein
VSALVDTHLHLARHEFDSDRAAVLERARAAGIFGFLHVGYDHETIPQAVAMARELDASWASAGIHPHDATSWSPKSAKLLRELRRDDAIVAIGECGFDFFRDLSPRAVQREAFVQQIELAKELDLPLVFHVRDAYAQTRELLVQVGLPPRRGVFHAFAGDAEFARWAVGEGFKLGIGGPLSYRSGQLSQSIAALSADAFLLETDAPWLPPQPWRGKRNEPAFLHHTARLLAGHLSLDLNALSMQLLSNFEALFAVRVPAGLRELDLSACTDPTAT